MRVKQIVCLSLLTLAISLTLTSQALAASAKPVFQLTVTPLPTHIAPDSKGEIMLVANNVGAGANAGPVTLTDTLPLSLAPLGVSAGDNDGTSAGPGCEVVAQTITCIDPGPLGPGRHIGVRIFVQAGGAEGIVSDEAQIEGGGAAPVSAVAPVRISFTPAGFDFLDGAAGFNAPSTDPDGMPTVAAGSRPYQLTVNVGFPTERRPGGVLLAAGHLRDATADLPRGMIVNPGATPVLCTEAELVTEGNPGCPSPSQIGTATILTTGIVTEAATSPLYNMVPPPGAASSFSFDAVGAGLFPHIIGGVRSDGDYGLTGASNDILGLKVHPIFGVRLELWGDPSSAGHDGIRGGCVFITCTASEEPQNTALLTIPVQCSGQPNITRAHADSWEEPGLFKEATYQSADLEGNPVSISGCNQLEFKPTIAARPTTNLADSPSGLDVDLHQPQDTELGHNSPAALKDATVTLPQGMAVDPSQANGLGACGGSEIGLTTRVGEIPIHFSKAPDFCPGASKLGTVEVTSPLLAEYKEEGTKLVTDPETGRGIPRPLRGSVYLAKPFENPFGSLLAIYLSIDDPQSGTIAKLAGRIEPDPLTGRLTTVFAENPQLPIEDVKLHLFGGARGALITPPTCGTHTTITDLTPWSAPETLNAHPEDSFQTTTMPGGGNCPTSETQLANAPAFRAGTVSPQAGAYSPFVLKLSREDGSQRLAKIDTTLPPGVAAKFAGVGQCSEAQIAQAQSRSHPNEGILERQSPSCPSSSEVGTVDVAAGAGPVPIHAQGTVYLAGPYKGAPLSLAIVTPAIAGPFDLGAVVVRTALYVDPDTAQGRAVSDPLPTILDGIPLDLRSVAVNLGRPTFTLNPTSCDKFAVTGTATSSLGFLANLTSPFQVGGCKQLPFKPKLSLKLRGGTKRASHPKLIATLKAKPGEANIASAEVKLPPSAFLDQAHIRTVCTRVQFAADQCPQGSIYGTATAVTPLLSDPLSGNVYLRSSNHKLPDLAVALKGPASLPIEIDLDGKTDSVKGALRNTFEAVPDAPVSKFRLELFGGKKGLVINSRNLCAHAYRAEVNLDGQNGKAFDASPAMGTDCKGQKHRHRRRM
jgi:hypothetical protein